MRIIVSIISLLISGLISAQKIWSFNDCLAYARENNLQVIASKLAEQTQESSLKIAKNEKLPNLTGAISNGMTFGMYPKYKNNQELVDDALKKGYQPYLYEYSGTFSNNMSIESSILLYNKGNLKINQAKNQILLQQQRFITDKIKDDISLQLTGNYLTVLLNKELTTVNKNSLDTYIDSHNRNQKLYKAGSIPLSSLYESQANLSNAKQNFENSKIELDRSLMTMAMLLQKDYKDFVVEDVNITDNLESPLFNVDETISYAYENQPVIKSAELGVKASEKDIDLAKTALYPSIAGTYRLGTNYTDLFNGSDNNKSLNDQWYDEHKQSLFINISIPIFNKGITKERIEVSKIKKIISQNELDQQKLTLKQSIQTSYFDVTSSYQTYLSAIESVKSTQLAYEFGQKSFDAGRINMYDLNITRNNYFNAQSQMLQSKYSYLFRLKILDFYTGKSLEIAPDDKIYNNLNSSIKSSYTETSNSIPSKTNTKEEPITNIVKTEVENTPTQQIPDNTTKENIKKEPVINTAKTEVENTPTQVPDNTAKENIKKEPVTNIVKTEVENTPTQVPDNTAKENVKKEPVTNIVKTEVENTPTQVPDNTAKENVKEKEKPNMGIIKENKTENKNHTSEEAKREALIKQRRERLSQGSTEANKTTDARREELIKERRAKLSKGLE